MLSGRLHVQPVLEVCAGGHQSDGVRVRRHPERFLALLPVRICAEDFAFKHRMWIYSGRRGIHCWVADAIARQLNNVQRTAVIEYLSVLDVRSFRLLHITIAVCTGRRKAGAQSEFAVACVL